MSLVEVMPAVRALSRTEKLRLVELIASELSREGGSVAAETETGSSAWSPCASFEAAHVLLRALKEDGGDD